MTICGIFVFRRHPAWVVPKMQMEIPSYAKWLFRNIPGVQWAVRSLIFWYNELNFPSFQVNTAGSKICKYCPSFLWVTFGFL